MIDLSGLNVRKLINILNSLPPEYPVSFYGDGSPAMLIDRENKVVMFDNTDWFEQEREEKKEELRRLIIEKVNKFDGEPDEDKEELFKEFLDLIIPYYDGTDYMEYKDGTITNEYINFDSNCGLSIITASISFDEVVDYLKEIQNKKTEYTLADMIEVLSDMGERTEYWDDLIDPDDNYCWEYDGEGIAEAILEIGRPWQGEYEFERDIRRALS